MLKSPPSRIHWPPKRTDWPLSSRLSKVISLHVVPLSFPNLLDVIFCPISRDISSSPIQVQQVLKVRHGGSCRDVDSRCAKDVWDEWAEHFLTWYTIPTALTIVASVVLISFAFVLFKLPNCHDFILDDSNPIVWRVDCLHCYFFIWQCIEVRTIYKKGERELIKRYDDVFGINSLMILIFTGIQKATGKCKKTAEECSTIGWCRTTPWTSYRKISCFGNA